jgi:hypothetical protein
MYEIDVGKWASIPTNHATHPAKQGILALPHTAMHWN